jgi:hypothetical protein
LTKSVAAVAEESALYGRVEVDVEVAEIGEWTREEGQGAKR